MRFLPLLLSLLVFIGACEKEQGPPVVISDVRVIAPMPGSTMGVGYMSIANRGEEPITVDAVSSPQFEMAYQGCGAWIRCKFRVAQLPYSKRVAST